MLGEKLWVRGLIASELGISVRKVHCIEHHQSHAATAFLTAPTEDAAIITADGVGEWATLTVGRGLKKADGSARIDLLRELRFPHSLGLFYSAVTSFLGFEVNEGEYKVMGLASYGLPTQLEAMRTLIRPTGDGAFSLDMDYFDFVDKAETGFSRRFVDLFGPPRLSWQPIDLASENGRRFADIASSAQWLLEEQMLAIASDLRRETGLTDLCLGGGVALNGVANARILRETGFERLFVPSAPGDAGCALGAALYADRILFGNRHRPVPDHPFWGPEPDEAALLRVAREDGLPASTREDGPMIEEVADALATNRIVGWVEGALEFGPRALGHRTILAAPHDGAMRDRLNRDIKYREEFRPFAPVVAVEHADIFFDLPSGGARLGRFMSGVFPVRSQWAEHLAAVTHVDGTARVQVLEREMAPRLHRLLEAYGRRSGIPVLLNTSFNLAGEPIVNRVEEAYSTFRRSGIDLLVAGSVCVSKPSAPLTRILENAA
jgi:carbamoyltransferase